MVFFVAPFAVAGYRHYMKKKAEREAREQLDEEGGGQDLATENSTEDSDGQIADKDRNQEEVSDRIGPMGKFIIFCQKLEKERKEAEEKILKRFVKDAMKQDGLEIPTKEPVASSSTEEQHSADPVNIVNTPLNENIHGTTHQVESSATAPEVPDVSQGGKQERHMKRSKSAPSIATASRHSLHIVSGPASTRMNRSRTASV